MMMCGLGIRCRRVKAIFKTDSIIHKKAKRILDALRFFMTYAMALLFISFLISASSRPICPAMEVFSCALRIR
ncbi:hypothetical protein QFZ51_002145 [Chitinophaga sp. W3I9]